MSPIAYSRTSADKLVEGYLDAVAHVQKLALRTQDRYRAALDRFQDFCRDAQISAIDTMDQATVEDFVKWLRGQKRTRNGAAKGKRDFYKAGGVKFILSTCRSAFNWAARHRMLPPFAQNPFILFQIDKLKDPVGNDGEEPIFSKQQELAFFAACNAWQKPIFTTLASYGLRLGELTHLLVDDVDFTNGVFVIRSKPWLFWSVKTGRERKLPLLPGTTEVFEKAIGSRKAGFVFLNAEFATGRARPAVAFAGPQAFKAYVEKLSEELLAVDPAADERKLRRAVVAFCRSMGQIPEKRVRCEFMGLTEKIGCPEFTRAHDLRHLFTTRAQAAGVNPLLVQEMLGHTTLEMTRKYTHLGMDSKRAALAQMDSPKG